LNLRTHYRWAQTEGLHCCHHHCTAVITIARLSSPLHGCHHHCTAVITTARLSSPLHACHHHFTAVITLDFLYGLFMLRNRGVTWRETNRHGGYIPEDKFPIAVIPLDALTQSLLTVESSENSADLWSRDRNWELLIGLEQVSPCAVPYSVVMCWKETAITVGKYYWLEKVASRLSKLL